VLTTTRAALLLTRNDEVWIPPHAERSRARPSRPTNSAPRSLALADELDLAGAGRFATAAAALAASGRGELPRLPTRVEVTALAGDLPGGEDLTLDGIVPADAPGPGRPAE
jgi:hypothetical protein